MAEPAKPLAVFDCNVFAQALINPNGPAGALVEAAARGTLRLFVTEHLLVEIRELPFKLPPRLGVGHARVDRLLGDLLAYAEPVSSIPSVFTAGRDPDDAAYVDLAAAAGAEYLVTRDKDLLALAADTAEGRAFALRFPGLRVVDPVAFLQLLPTRQGRA